MRAIDAVLAAIVAFALVTVGVVVMTMGTAHAGQFERKAFLNVREPYFEPPQSPQEIDVPTDWREVGRDEFEAAYGPVADEAPTYDYEAPVYDYEPAAYDYGTPAYDYAPTTYAPTYDTGYAPSDGLTRDGGVNHHEGRTETYYSSAVTRHVDTDQWTVDGEGFYRDQEGRYVVAASDMERGTVFEGSKGECIVLDTGCAAGVTDYYCNW